ncbi:MAG: phosphatase PAP2 family protein [Candidatus Magasanikbacteria bacterium]|nr:phosphatase PAP2 family protein [Candidatus Magasanikbacteria bacterium]MBT4071824.1 phosphatase PAP2 family protein [Candidatus Magasanikbacteria bacterium]
MAYGGIVFLVLSVILWVIYVEMFRGHEGELDVFIYCIPIALALGLAVSWFIGWILPHRRPALEFPTTKQLIHPLSNWKAFPSDHTMIAFIFVTIGMILGMPIIFVVCLAIFALLIGASRVWVGVHYPRDILGGMVLGVFVSIISIYFFG